MWPSNQQTHDHQLGTPNNCTTTTKQPLFRCNKQTESCMQLPNKYVNNLQFYKNIRILMEDDLYTILAFNCQ